MQKIIKEDLEIERETLSREEAEEFFEENEYKTQILNEEAGEGDELSFYSQGEFTDLCKGPHVSSTGKLRASSFWRSLVLTGGEMKKTRC